MNPSKNQTIEERCDCGKLLVKRTVEGVEIKCSRCKRIHFIPYDPEARDPESSAQRMEKQK